MVLDFGVARLAEARTDLTHTGTVLGTPGYMSPEQARGEREVDARADVFSFGGVLFKCLTGQAAFAAESVVAQLAKILFAAAPRPQELRPELPRPWRDAARSRRRHRMARLRCWWQR